jgi:hypothetical protein
MPNLCYPPMHPVAEIAFGHCAVSWTQRLLYEVSGGLGAKPRGIISWGVGKERFHVTFCDIILGVWHVKLEVELRHRHFSTAHEPRGPCAGARARSCVFASRAAGVADNRDVLPPAVARPTQRRAASTEAPAPSSAAPLFKFSIEMLEV